ncbi:MAG: DUF1049 domain-containing protein [Aquificaceae bacterium]
MNFIKVLLIVILTVAFLIFVIQHAYYVNLNLFGSTYAVPLFVIILFSLALGFLLPTVYFLVREVRLRSFIKNVGLGVLNLFNGYPSKAERDLSGPSKKEEWVSLLLAQALLQKDGIDKLEELGVISTGGSLDALLGSMFLKGRDYQKAKDLFISSISRNPANLRALRGLRDLSFLEEDHQACIEYQQRVLKQCEKWEKEEEKRIMAEVFSHASEKLANRRRELLEKAMDTKKSFYVYACWIQYLLDEEDIKEVKRQIEKVFDANLQNQVFMVLSRREEHLANIIDILRERGDHLQPDVLARLYMKLNILTQLKDMLDKLSEPLKLMALTMESHRDVDRLCNDVVSGLYKPWVCTCGEYYNYYVPFCERCFSWGNIKLRGNKHVGGLRKKGSET